MSSVVFSTAVAVFALALIVALWAVVRVLLRSFDQPRQVGEPVTLDGPIIPRNEWRLEIEARMDSLKLAVADGIERVARAENRIQKTVTSARRAVRDAGLEHAGIEAEFEGLEPSDDSRNGALPPVPEVVDESRTIRFPGGSLEIGAA